MCLVYWLISTGIFLQSKLHFYWIQLLDWPSSQWALLKGLEYLVTRTTIPNWSWQRLEEERPGISWSPTPLIVKLWRIYSLMHLLTRPMSSGLLDLFFKWNEGFFLIFLRFNMHWWLKRCFLRSVKKGADRELFLENITRWKKKVFQLVFPLCMWSKILPDHNARDSLRYGKWNVIFMYE